MAVRAIVRIDEEKCTGCGFCIPDCAEGALQIMDGKARLVSEVYCDGLGACLGACPEGALTIEEQEAEAFDEAAVEAHLAAEPEADLPCGCPGSALRSIEAASRPVEPAASALSHWPVQLRLVPPEAPFLRGADLLICADCVPFAMGDLHHRYLAGASSSSGVRSSTMRRTIGRSSRRSSPSPSRRRSQSFGWRSRAAAAWQASLPMPRWRRLRRRRLRCTSSRSRAVASGKRRRERGGRTMGYRCPGLAGRTLTSKLIPCPSCGREVEIFSDEASVRCPACRGRVLQDPAASCRSWCNGCSGTPVPRGEPSAEGDGRTLAKSRD